jgi:hypothetical protein
MRHLTAAVLIALSVSTTIAFADEPVVRPQTKVPATPIADSIARVRIDADDTYPFGAKQQSAKKNSTASKITAGFAMGLLGFIGGAYVGAKLQPDCRCDDPGLTGALIGAPIGGIAGAIAGVLLASR